MGTSRTARRVRTGGGAALLTGVLLAAGCSADGGADGIPEAGPTAPDTATPSARPGETGATSTTTPATTTPGSPGGTAAPTSSGRGADPTSATAAPQALELPRGGTEVFPRYRLFGYAGAPLSPGLGRLGIGDLDDRVREMQERGAAFAGGRELLPVLELIATIVHPVPGPDGTFRTHQPDAVVQEHLEAARRHDALLLLNIQPGRADFLDEVRRWEHVLVEPDVGVALDPEWAVGDGQVPGEVYGRTTGEELDAVAAYLAGLVEEHGLPEKVMVYHQVHTSVVREEERLREHPGVVVVKSVDGIGHPEDKVLTYDLVNEHKPDHVAAGFKLFYEEDAAYGPLMTAAEVLGLDPQPEYILFE